MFRRRKTEKENKKHPPTEQDEVNRPKTVDPSKKTKQSDNNDMDRKMAAVEATLRLRSKCYFGLLS